MVAQDDIAESIDEIVNNFSLLLLICVCVKEEKELVRESELGS